MTGDKGTLQEVFSRIDWEAAQSEALAYLQELIRIETINPPGNEHRAARRLEAILAKEGIESQVLEAAPGRSNLLAYLPGSLGDRSRLMLSSHLDVVAVERGAWRRDPFGAEVADGCVWGRGAFDMKSKTAFDLMTMLLTKRLGLELRNGLLLCAVADEEAGSRLGSQWLVERHPEKVRSKYVFNEAGGFPVEGFGRRFYPIQVAERGLCWLKLTVTGEPGHGSMPRPDSAPIKLARVVCRLGESRLPLHVTAEARAFFRHLASGLGSGEGSILPDPSELDSRAGDLEQMPLLGSFLYPMLHNTVSPNVLHCGSKINVIPGEASVELDGRLLPGQSSSDLIREIREIVGEEPKLEILATSEGVRMPEEGAMFELLREAIVERDPQAVVLPWLMPGFTDSKNWSRLGALCYGFHPVSLPPGEPIGTLAHGHNERILVEGFYAGLKTYLTAVWRYCLDGDGST